jgi:hypothetical protein
MSKMATSRWEIIKKLPVGAKVTVWAATDRGGFRRGLTFTIHEQSDADKKPIYLKGRNGKPFICWPDFVDRNDLRPATDGKPTANMLDRGLLWMKNDMAKLRSIRTENKLLEAAKDLLSSREITWDEVSDGLFTIREELHRIHDPLKYESKTVKG